MATSSNHLTILGIAGSLRRASYNRGLIRAAVEVAPAGTRVLPYDLAEYNSSTPTSRPMETRNRGRRPEARDRGRRRGCSSRVPSTTTAFPGC